MKVYSSIWNIQAKILKVFNFDKTSSPSHGLATSSLYYLKMKFNINKRAMVRSLGGGQIKKPIKTAAANLKAVKIINK